jgi:hypothetical protein
LSPGPPTTPRPNLLLATQGVKAARTPLWSSARLLFQVAGVMLAAVLVAGVCAHAEFDPAKLLSWLFAAGSVAVTAGGAAMYWRMQMRARRR